MADEVVGDVRIDVHGNTDPLKSDVRRAAQDIGKTLETEINSGSSGAVTENIVQQVTDAEAPSEKEAQKVGRAIAKGVDVGTKDIDTQGRIAEDLRRAESPLRKFAAELGAALGIQTGESMGKARRDAITKITEDDRVKIAIDRDGFLADLDASERDWERFGDSMSRSIEVAFMPWWKARAALREDVRVQVRVEREKFRAELTDTQRDWSDFGESMGRSLDAAFAPWWKRLLSDDSGALALFGRFGERLGEKAQDGVAKGASKKKGGSNWVEQMFGKIQGVALPLALQGAMYGIGARAAAVIGGGLVSQLATVGTGIAGWASSIVGQAGQAVIGVGAVVAGTIGTAFAGLGATAYSSIAALMPALAGLKLAFSGMEKEEKKAFDERLKNATKNLQGFGKAVRAELLEPMFDAIKQFDKLVPTLNAFGTTLGKTAAGLVTEFAQVFTSGPMVNELNTFLQASAGYLSQIGDAGIGLASKILPAFNAIAPVTQKFFDDISSGMDLFAEKIAKVSAGGTGSVLTATLDAWYERGKRLFGVFGTLAGTVLKVLNIGAETRGDSFLTSLEKTADKFKFFIDTIAANDVLGNRLGAWYDRGADLVSAFGNLSKIVLLFFDTAGDAAGDAFGSFRAVTEEWLRSFKEFRASGDLGDILSKWYAQGETLLSILGNVGASLVNIFKAASGTAGDFLTDFEKITQTWEDWTGSFSGQKKLTDYFDGAADVLNEVWGLLGDIAGLFGPTFMSPSDNLVNFFKDIRENWVPALEDLMDTLRDSGIQDALWGLFDALKNLLSLTSTARVMFEFLTVGFEAIAGALKLMGPLLPMFVTWVATMRVLSLLKFGATSLGLTKMAGGMKAVAAATKTGGVAGGLKTLTGVLGPLNVALAGAAIGLGAIVKIANQNAGNKVFIESMGDISKTMDEVIQKDWTNITAPDLGWVTDFDTLVGRTMGMRDGFMGFVDDAFVKMSALFGVDMRGNVLENIELTEEAIGNLAKSGNFDLAFDRFDELEQWLTQHGGDPRQWREGLEALRVELENTEFDTFQSKLQGLLDVGDWETATQQAGEYLATASAQGIDPTTLQTIHDLFVDMIAATGETDVISFSGVLDQKVLDQQVADLKKVKGMWKDGGWTTIGKDAYDELVEGFIQEDFGTALQTQLDAIPKTLANFDPTAGGGKGAWTKTGIKLRAEVFAEANIGSLNGVTDAVDAATKDKLIQIYADPTHWDEETGELKTEWQEQEIELLLTGVDKAKAEMNAFLKGEREKPGLYVQDPKSGEYRKKTRDELLAGYEPEGSLTIQLGIETDVAKSKLDTTLNEYKSKPTVIPFEANTSKLGPGTVQPVVTAKYKYNNIEVPIKGVWQPLPPVPKPKDSTTDSGYPAVGPRVGPVMIAPSMISPGGPTTMGYSDSFSPFAAGRASTSGSGVVGSPNRWDDDPRAVKNITINNYYPEPERASDTVAMSLRLARYGG